MLRKLQLSLVSSALRIMGGPPLQYWVTTSIRYGVPVRSSHVCIDSPYPVLSKPLVGYGCCQLPNISVDEWGSWPIGDSPVRNQAPASDGFLAPVPGCHPLDNISTLSPLHPCSKQYSVLCPRRDKLTPGEIMSMVNPFFPRLSAYICRHRHAFHAVTSTTVDCGFAFEAVTDEWE